MIERHYTIKELRDILNISFSKALSMIKNEPGVRKFGGDGAKRQTYRIPESVLERILRRSTNPA